MFKSTGNPISGFCVEEPPDLPGPSQSPQSRIIWLANLATIVPPGLGVDAEDLLISRDRPMKFHFSNGSLSIMRKQHEQSNVYQVSCFDCLLTIGGHTSGSVPWVTLTRSASRNFTHIVNLTVVLQRYQGLRFPFRIQRVYQMITP